MLSNNTATPNPINLEQGLFSLCQVQGIELPDDYPSTITDQPLDIKHISKLANDRGLIYQRHTVTLEQFPDTLFPCLIQLRRKKFHIALEQQNEEIRVLMPNGEELWLHKDELQTEYSGVIHQLSQETTNKKIQPSKRQWLKEQVLKLWPQYFQVLLATLLINLLTLCLPVFTHFIFDKVLPGYAMDTLFTISVGMMVILVLDFLLRWLRSYFLDDACRSLARQAEFDLLEKVLKLEKHQLPFPAAQITQIIQDFARIKESISSSVMLAVLDIPFFVLFSVAIWIIGGPLVWIPITIAALLIPLSFVNFRLAHRSTREKVRSHHDKNVYLHETIRGLDTLRAMDSSTRTLIRWRVLLADASSREFNNKQAGTLLNALVASAAQAVVFSMLVTGVLLIQQGILAPGSLFACIILGSRAIAPMANLSMALNRINQAKLSLQQIQALFSLEKLDDNNQTTGKSLDSLGGIAVENLSFGYPGSNNPILNDISFTIKPGEKVALLGASGAGKSTLIDLLQGNLNPTQGDITVNHISLSDINLKDYRRCLGVARQQPTLFAGTLRSNLLMGCASAKTKDLDKVCALVGLDQFIARCPAGYDHPVKEKGLNLSVGQQQALCLARTILHGGELFILDEPTSSFDNVHESLLCQQMPNFIGKDQMLLLITHRASLLKLVDRIILLADGKIVADGPRDQILATMNGQN